MKQFYRYEAITYSLSSGDDELYLTSTKLVLKTYNLFRETPKGYWIGYGLLTDGLRSDGRWVSKTAKKRFAYPTKKEALNNFIRRSEKHISILQNQIDARNMALREAKLLDAKS